MSEIEQAQQTALQAQRNISRQQQEIARRQQRNMSVASIYGNRGIKGLERRNATQRSLSGAQQQLAQQSRDVQDYQSSINQAAQEQARSQRINDAIKNGLNNKYIGDLNKQDREIVVNAIKKIEDTADNNARLGAVDANVKSVQEKLGQTLSPELRKSIERQVLAGKTTIQVGAQDLPRQATTIEKLANRSLPGERLQSFEVKQPSTSPTLKEQVLKKSIAQPDVREFRAAGTGLSTNPRIRNTTNIRENNVPNSYSQILGPAESINELTTPKGNPPSNSAYKKNDLRMSNANVSEFYKPYGRAGRIKESINRGADKLANRAGESIQLFFTDPKESYVASVSTRETVRAVASIPAIPFYLFERGQKFIDPEQREFRSQLTTGEKVVDFIEIGSSLLAAVPVARAGVGAGLGLVTREAAPIFSTRFLAKEVGVNAAGNQVLRTGAETTVTGAGMPKRFLSFSETAIKKTGDSEGVQDFVSATRGVVAEQRGYDLIRGRPVLRKSEEFASGDVGQVIDQKLSLPILKVKGLSANQEVEGFVIKSVGKSAIKGKPLQYSADVNFGAPIDEKNIFIAGRSVPFVKGETIKLDARAKQFSRGILQRGDEIAEDGASTIVTGSSLFKKSLTSSELAEIKAKQSIETIVRQKLTSSTKPAQVFSKPRAPIGAGGILQESSRPTIVGGTGAQGSFAGQGTYEKTDEVLFTLGNPRSGQSDRQGSSTRTGQGQFNVMAQGPSQKEKQVPRQPQVPRSGEAFRSAFGQISLLGQGQGPGQAQSPRTTSPPLNTPRTPIVPASPLARSSGESSLARTRRLRNLLLGYKTFLKRRGKKVYLPGIAPRGKALRKGTRATKETLAATFGIEEAGFTSESDVSFNVPGNDFRDYLIRGRKKIALQDTFVQRSGSAREGGAGRLSNRGEIFEIRGSKKGRLKLF